MKKHGWLCLFTVLCMSIFCTAMADVPDQQMWRMVGEGVLYRSPSASAMVLDRPADGQIVHIDKSGEDGWQYVFYTDQLTNASYEGWMHPSQMENPPESYDYWLYAAQNAAAQRLADFAARVDVTTAIPAYRYASMLREQAACEAIGIVAGDQVYLRVALTDIGFGHEVSHFVLHHPMTGVPVARLNRTDGDGKNRAVFEGVADYPVSEYALRLSAVYADVVSNDAPGFYMVRDTGEPGRWDGSSFVKTARIHPSMPEMTFTVTDLGVPTGAQAHTLQVNVTAADGSAVQDFRFESRLVPGDEYQAFSMTLIDVNFDGYLDLNLLTAMGAANSYSVLSVWLPEAGRFSPAMEDVPMCNLNVNAAAGILFSTESDGYADVLYTAWRWTEDGTLQLAADAELKSGGQDEVAESVVRYGLDGTPSQCWGAVYPQSWYFAMDTHAERYDAILAATLHNVLDDMPRTVVANVDWVNLRMRDTKSSVSLAKLPAGTEVTILRRGCGADAGWVRVWYTSPEGVGFTGYIWHSYLAGC